MIDFERELASLDLMAAPDLSADIERRARRLEVPPHDGSKGSLPSARRVLAAVLALALGAAAVFLLTRAFRPSPVGAPATPGPSPSAAADPWASLPPGWTRLADLPGNRSGASTVWTGRELVYWGGITDAGKGPPDGFAYDPGATSWRALPDSPLSARTDAWAVWTGTEVLIWGGRSFGGLPLMDGAAFDPAASVWRTIPAPPLEPRFPAAVDWTGRELIAWGGGPSPALQTDTYQDGAAFDPDTDTWRRIASGPFPLNRATSVWTGTEMIVLGAHGNTKPAQGAAYDPAADRWRVIAPSSLSPNASAVAWTGHEMVAWDYELRAAAYDPVTNTWRDLASIPLDVGECYPSTAFAADTILAWYCGQAAALDVRTGTWSVATPPGSPGFRPGVPAPAGNAFVIAAEQGVDRQSSDPGKGLWVYKPGPG